MDTMIAVRVNRKSYQELETAIKKYLQPGLRVHKASLIEFAMFMALKSLAEGKTPELGQGGSRKE